MMQLSHSSISDKAYEALSGLIINHKLKPGERLIEEQLAKEMGISRTPLRDAINRLAKDGFITLEPRKGASVREFKMEDVVEIYDIRMALEGLAARLSASQLDVDELSALKMKFASKEAKVLVKADTELHDLIIRKCGNKKLIHMLDNLYVHIQLFRVAGYCSKERSDLATLDHNAILDALMQGNGDLAEEIMRKHIQKTRDEIVQEFEKQRSIEVKV